MRKLHGYILAGLLALSAFGGIASMLYKKDAVIAQAKDEEIDLGLKASDFITPSGYLIPTANKWKPQLNEESNPYDYDNMSFKVQKGTVFSADISGEENELMFKLNKLNFSFNVSVAGCVKEVKIQRFDRTPYTVLSSVSFSDTTLTTYSGVLEFEVPSEYKALKFRVENTNTEYYISNFSMTAYKTITTANVSFDMQDHGSQVASQTVDIGGKVTQPSNPSATGYTFGGWYKESGCVNAWNFNTDTISGDTILYAKWTADTYTIAFNGNGSTSGSTASVTATYNNTRTLTNNGFSRTGYDFQGWATSSGGSKVYNNGATLTVSQVNSHYNTVGKGKTFTLYAVWTLKSEIQAVINDINNIGSVTYPGSRTKINTARTNYNNLNSNYKPLVSNYSILTSKESQYNSLKEAAINNVESLISSIGTVSYPTSKEAIVAAENAYNALYSGDRGEVDNYSTLTTARSEFDTLRAAAIANVISAIDSIGDVNYPSSKAAIINAETLYSQLHNDDKNSSVITNQDVMIGDRSDYNNQRDNAVTTVIANINAISKPFDLDNYDDEIATARDSYEALDEDEKNTTWITNYQRLLDAEAASPVTKEILAIDSTADFDTYEAAVNNARSHYEALTSDQKAFVSPEIYKILVDNEEACPVIELINNIGPLTYDGGEDDSLDAIVLAEEAYDALSLDQKELVNNTNHDVLLYDRETYDNTKEACDLIADIGKVTHSDTSKEKLDDAREKYDSLNEEAKALVNNYNDSYKTLDDDEHVFKALEKIDAIGEVFNNKDTKDHLDDARTYYDSLTDDQKALIDAEDYKTLVDDEHVYNALVKIDSIGDITYDKDCKDRLDDARSTYDALTDDQKALIKAKDLKTLTDDENVYETVEKIYEIGDVIYDYESKERIEEARAYYDSLSDDQKALVNPEFLKLLTDSEVNYENKELTGNVIVIVFLILSCILLIIGSILMYILLKKKNDNDDDNNQNGNGKKKQVTAMSFSLPLILAAVGSTSHYLDAPFIALYIIAGLTILVWLSDLIIFLVKKHAKNKVVEFSVDNNDEDEVITVIDNQGHRFQIRFIKSFMAKYIQSSDETKAYYNELKNEVLSYKKTNSRISWSFDSINAGREYVIKFGMRGKTLCVYYPLNADDYIDSKYKVEKVEAKKYEAVPCLYRINNDRRLSYAKELIALVASKLGLEKGETPKVNYYLPYEDREPLLARGLIKELKVLLNPVEAPTPVNEEEEVIRVVENGVAFEIRFNRSYTAKLIQSSDEAKGYYNELKNHILSYKGVSNRTSWHYESFNSGRTQLLKFNVKGKTLCVYYPLKVEDYKDSKYIVEEATSKKFDEVPCLYRIKNPRRCSYAKKLIDEVMKANGIKRGEEQHEKYDLPYESRDPLLARGLIKEVKTRAKEVVSTPHHNKISVFEADTKMSDEVAASYIKEDAYSKRHKGKKAIINIDTIGENYSDGDKVTLESLIEKKLVPSDTGYVKVLGRGYLSKKLHVDLQDYSLKAVKMIVLEGGTVEKAK